MADYSEVIDMLKNGEGKQAFHKLGDMLHKPMGRVQTNDEGSGGNSPPPPPPPTDPKLGG